MTHIASYCSTCDTAIVFDDTGWRHADPLRDLEHTPTPDVGLLGVRPK